MASYVLTQLAGLQVQTEPVVNLDMDHYRTLHQRLIEHEELLYGTAEQVQVWKFVALYSVFALIYLFILLIFVCLSLGHTKFDLRILVLFFSTITKFPFYRVTAGIARRRK